MDLMDLYRTKIKQQEAEARAQAEKEAQELNKDVAALIAAIEDNLKNNNFKAERGSMPTLRMDVVPTSNSNKWSMLPDMDIEGDVVAQLEKDEFGPIAAVSLQNTVSYGKDVIEVTLYLIDYQK